MRERKGDKQVKIEEKGREERKRGKRDRGREI